MDLRVSFMGVIAQVTGEKEVALSFDQVPTLRALLEDLEHRYGAAFGARLFRTSRPPRLLQMCTRIFVNGNLVDPSQLDEPVPPPPADAGTAEVLVYLLPAACGG